MAKTKVSVKGTKTPNAQKSVRSTTNGGTSNNSLIQSLSNTPKRLGASERAKAIRQEQKNQRKQSQIASDTIVKTSALAGANAVQSKTVEEQQKTQRERARQQTYRAALDKWNGVVRNTPEPAEGSNDAEKGSRGPNNDTGVQIGWLQ